MRTLLLTTMAFFSLAAVAQAATAPAVSTSAATSVAPNSATFNGSVNPNGENTTWYFQYGTTTNYGSRTPNQNAGAGFSPAAVSATVSGLQGGRTYHFRLVATSAGGTSTGADMTFSTGTAPGVTTLAASSVGTTTARFNGRVDPNGQATTYYFDYGTTTAYGLRTPTRNAGSGNNTVNVNAAVSNLTAGSTYHFRLVATNASGTSFGGDLAINLAGAPVVVTNANAAQNVLETTATLTGSVDPKGRSTNWYFDYGTTTGYGSRTPTQNAGSGQGPVGVSANITGLTVGQTYHFRLVATNNVGTTTGPDLTFSTAPIITIKQAALRVTAGRWVQLSGTVSVAQPGIKVTILGQPFGESALTPTADVITGGGGAWSYLARPKIMTTYRATALGGTSAPLTIGVRPSVLFKRIAGNRFSVKVGGASSFAGKIVKLQRMASNGRWVTEARARLNSNSVAIFRAAVLPKGRLVLRIAMSVNQAGPGYLGGLSRQLPVRR
jgi:hypothetical protein